MERGNRGLTIRERRAWVSTVDMSMPSMRIRPDSGRAEIKCWKTARSLTTLDKDDLLVARSASAKVLLPEPAVVLRICMQTPELPKDLPVLPMIAVVDPALILTEIEDNAGSR